MEAFFQTADQLQTWLVGGILLLFGLIEIASGFLRRSRRRFSDWIQEAGGFAALALLIKPAILFASVAGLSFLLPGKTGLIAGWPLPVLFLIFLLVDDFLQYVYHRAAHEYSFLWKLHRPHHQAEEMGFFVSYRNAALYYWLMPNIWWIGIFTWLGGGLAVAAGLVLKQVVIISSHSTVKWDEPLYRSRFFRPLALVLERLIVTPAFHHAHHARSQHDGVGDPNANFGNMLSIWDQLFGTALYTHRFPESYGLMRPTNDHWTSAYLYPLVKSKDPKSEWSAGFVKTPTTEEAPAEVVLEKNKAYLWCTCGLSKEQPFCDGSHHGTKHRPLRFTARKDGAVKLCNCKRTGRGPFCDNAHRTPPE